jgi:G3E family GTPase
MTTLHKVPVIVLTGFLGSGKTTLLNRLLLTSKEQQLKPAVLMNELGTLDVDGALVSNVHSDVQMETLIDGCICCSKKSEIPISIDQLLLKQPDVIFIELTGVANPEEIADALSEPAVINHVSLHRIVTLVNAEHVLEYNNIFYSDKELIHTLRSQLKSADWLIVNKMDRIHEHRLARINKLLQKQNPTAQVVYTTHADIDTNVLLEGLYTITNDETTTQRRKLTFPLVSKSATIEVRPSFSRLQTISFRLEEPVAIEKKKIDSLIYKYRKQIVRAKGFMKLTYESYPQMMLYSGWHTVWQSIHYKGESLLVIIGFDLDTDTFTADWLALQRGARQ